MMEEYDRLMPEYDFASNKGYGSQTHIEALKKYGPTPIHRASFIKKDTCDVWLREGGRKIQKIPTPKEREGYL